MCPCDLSDVLDMTVGGVSQHLRKLKDVGIVHDKKVGQTVFYSINKEKTQIIQPVLMSLSSWAKKELV
jgi:DNA-binding transcriptional ArsR family regulator